MKGNRVGRAPLLLATSLLAWLVLASSTSGVSFGAPLFPNQEFAAGVRPTSVAVGDFNCDGRQDLAVANGVSNNVSVLLGRGDGTFGPATNFSAGVSPSSIVIADFNGDGHQDLAVANFGFPGVSVGDVSILLGQGDGTFAPQTRVGVGSFPYFIAVGDFDGDGRQDLVLALVSSSNVSVLLGRGDGTFRPRTEFGADARPSCVAVGDFNGDGHQDLAVANSGSNDVSVLLGRGDGTFDPRTNIAIGISPGFVVIGDFDGDGRQDLAVLSGGLASILLGQGDGTFGPQTQFGAGGIPEYIAVSDFDGDGHQDLAVANQYTNDVSMLLGRGDGTFGPETRFWVGLSPVSIGVGDFDADGHQDMAVVNRDSYNVSILLGQGDGTFGPQTRVGTDSIVNFVVAADFDGDGDQDLALSYSASSYISVLLRQSDGTFVTRTFYAVGNSPVSIAVRDFDGDGHPDLAVANADSDDLSVLLSQGDGTFGTETRFGAGDGPASIIVGDFNADGRQDLAVANKYGSAGVSVLLGRGDGTFDAQVAFAAGEGPSSIAVGDFDADGRQDLAVANSSSKSVSILLGRGDGTFGYELFIGAGEHPTSIVVGEFNGDGRQDLAVANEGSFDVSVLLGQGDGTFNPQTRFKVGAYPRSIAVADFNADGRRDLAVANSRTDDISVLLGRGDGTFGPELRFGAGYFPISLTAGDFNGDGRQDVAVTNADPSVSILLNQGPYPASPHAVITATPVVECDQPGGAVVWLDGSGSQDSPGGGGLIAYEWLRDPGLATEQLIGTGVSIRPYLGLGTTQIGLRVLDASGRNDVATTFIEVTDTTPPTLACPTIGALECSAPGGSAASLATTATDVCSPTVSVTNTRTGGGGDASGFYPLGTTGVTFTATDDSGNTASCTMSVQVQDTVPPFLTLTLSPTVLWPPNHRMVLVQAAWHVSDLCDPGSNAVLAEVTSSEPDDAPGNSDGNTTSDIQDASIGNADVAVLLRAERSGDGPGRIYTLTYATTDASGNTSSALGLVTVPHDLGTGPEPVMMSLEGDGTPGIAHLYWNAVSGAEMYDVIQGDVSQVTQSNGKIWLGLVHVLATGQRGTSYSEGSNGALPLPGSAFFYLVQYRDAQGASGWGTESSSWPAEPVSCDVGCPGEVATTSVGSSRPLRR